MRGLSPQRTLELKVMLNSGFEQPEIENQVSYDPFPLIRAKPNPPQAYEVVPPVAKVNGARLLDACKVSVLPTPPTISSRILLKWADDGTRRS
jgi:hypothetical protein